MGNLHLRNISLKIYRDFLKAQGCVVSRSNGGHEIWTREDLSRPITFQSHIEPIPEFIIKNGLSTLGLTKQDFIKWLEK